MTDDIFRPVGYATRCGRGDGCNEWRGDGHGHGRAQFFNYLGGCGYGSGYGCNTGSGDGYGSGGMGNGTCSTKLARRPS